MTCSPRTKTKQKMGLPADQDFYWPKEAETQYRRNFTKRLDEAKGWKASLSKKLESDPKFKQAFAEHYQVDTWNPGGTSIVWVELPSFTGNVPLNNLDLYYGGSADYAGPNAAKTWSNGYQTVNQFAPSFDSVTAPRLVQ